MAKRIRAAKIPATPFLLGPALREAERFVKGHSDDEPPRPILLVRVS